MSNSCGVPGVSVLMDAPRIRPMTPLDIEQLVAWMVTIPLWQRYGLTAERAADQFDKALARDDLLLVADVGEKHSACGFAWCLPQGAFGRSVYLRLIGVRPDHASAGVGSALLAAVEAAAVRINEHVFLLVSDFNQDAQRFYRRHGYQPIGRIPGYVLPDVDELLYWKHLPK